MKPLKTPNPGAKRLNELLGSGRNTNVTVAGTTNSQATNVTVNGLSAEIYGDATFAHTNVGLVDGYNTFTAVAHDSYGRSSTDISISYKTGKRAAFFKLPAQGFSLEDFFATVALYSRLSARSFIPP
jgi:hypothetical protein